MDERVRRTRPHDALIPILACWLITCRVSHRRRRCSKYPHRSITVLTWVRSHVRLACCAPHRRWCARSVLCRCAGLAVGGICAAVQRCACCVHAVCCRRSIAPCCSCVACCLLKGCCFVRMFVLCGTPSLSSLSHTLSNNTHFVHVAQLTPSSLTRSLRSPTKQCKGRFLSLTRWW